MIVYGDPSYERPLPDTLGHLRTQLVSAAQSAAPRDALRTALIAAGQVEQAVEDAGVGGALAAGLRAVTDLLAAGFVGASEAASSEGSGSLGAGLRLLDGLPGAPDLDARLKVPEGFAFYTLYPEQYVAAAERWMADHDEARAASRVVVVGVRSIGTTLSAVARAALTRGGWECVRLTVRPTGHPFDRRVELPPLRRIEDAYGLVVDEGPGISGSSMAATAQALVDAGMPQDRVSLLPGHAGEPGSAATEQTRAWFGRRPRYVVPLEQLRWGGWTLPEVLAQRAAEALGENVTSSDNLGGGAWRKFVFADGVSWPAAYPAFERTKYRCASDSGRGVFWKFAGLGPGSDNPGDMAAAQAARQGALAGGGWTVAPLGTALGFVATPWVDGRPLQLGDRSPALLAHVARYVVAASPGVLSAAEQAAAWERLSHILYWNLREAFGDEAAAAVRALADDARRLLSDAPVPAYGDGRLAPHEWLRAADGRVLKTDCTGHARDHTAVGPQSLAWDLAGAQCEWGGDVASDAALLDAFRAAGGVDIPAAVLHVHRLAYAAFRLGMCSMAAAASSDADERRRLADAEAQLRQRITLDL